jgi:photosystem II stability/assembly factor-like uncharacterized protein
MSRAVPICLCLALAACGSKDPPVAASEGAAQVEITEQRSGGEARLQAVFAVSAEVVWASGVEGTVVKTLDGGATWTSLEVPDSENLQFRDLHAFDDQEAFVLSAGDGELSRIYRTRDGGKSWTLQFTMPESKGFLDCFDFWDSKRGFAYGDSVEGQLYLLTTSDGGATWKRVPPEALPEAGPGEGGFAASGTCARVGPEGRAWVGTGAGGNARVLRSDDWAQSFDASDVPVVTGEAAGVMSVILLGESLLALGGDLGKPEETTNNVAISIDGGATWKLRSSPGFTGAVYGASSFQAQQAVVAVGPKGADISYDQGASWSPLHRGDYWSVDFGSPRRFWAVGPGGRITRFELPD